MFGLGAGEILLIGIIALIFMGPKKIPEFARSLGKAIKEFENAKNEMTNPVEKENPQVAIEIPKEISKKES